MRGSDLTIMSRAPPCEGRARAAIGGQEIPARRQFCGSACLPGVSARIRPRGPVVDPRRGAPTPAAAPRSPGRGPQRRSGAMQEDDAGGSPLTSVHHEGLTAPAPALQFRALPRVPPDARWHGHAGAHRAGGRRRTAKTGRWLRPIRRGIGASNCAMRSAPSSTSCAAPSRSCARNSIRRTRRSEVADSAIRTQGRHSGSSPKPGPGAAVAFGPRCENVSCCRSQRTRRGGARSAARPVGT
jgi:hypothetical protein